MISENTIQGSSEEDQYAVETSHAVADPRSCTLQVDAHMSLNGKTQKQGRMGVGFRDITALRVKTQTQAIDERTAKAGVTGWKGRVVPESYIVQTFQGGNLSGIFFFRDEGTANRVAESISQAIRLCGGNVTPVQSK